MTYSDIALNGILSSIIAAADAGTGNAYLTIRSDVWGNYDGYYEGRNATTFAGELLLATFPLAKPCGVAANGVLTLDITNTNSLIAATGEATIWRLHRSDGVSIVDGKVTVQSGTGEIKFSATDWEADGVTNATLSGAAIVLLT